jgi:hypothetical protein
LRTTSRGAYRREIIASWRTSQGARDADVARC